MTAQKPRHRPSIWEIDSFPGTFDVVVIGSGIVGLNAAISLVEKQPAIRVAIVDRWYHPLGASTRNAGFATFGSLSELVVDIEDRGWDACLELVEKRWKGLQLLKQRVAPERMDYQVHGGYELFRREDIGLWERSLDRLDELNGHLKQIIGEKGKFEIVRSPAAGVSSVLHTVCCPAEGYLHPGKLTRTLIDHASAAGVTFFRPCHVLDWEENGGLLHVLSSEGLKLACRHLLFATNGFTARLLPDLEVAPARNQVLLTEKVKGLNWKGCYHSHAGYYYFRDWDGRILLGGARHIDPDGEKTDAFGFSEGIQSALVDYLRDVVVNQAVRIEHSWSGIMGVGKEKDPVVKRLHKGVYCAVRLGGMGVAIGSLAGEKAASLILKNA